MAGIASSACLDAAAWVRSTAPTTFAWANVALKLLPAALASDAQRLAQFHNEVRTARHVSHPNVCRVYDIGDIDGQLFLTMEYVDGEDLSSLIRRIGRLPEDKALEVARQICAGLAAAHERGVLHRDLKPANVMLDGTGKVRLMDFGLAAVGVVTDVRAGTPAYMAPEQLSGTEVTVRSDIFALGLVLYELFTGRRGFTATTLSELLEQHQAGTITSPIELVKTLDAAIDRVILRCLDSKPANRPPSALAVSAALPGGDPLAAALAAGETPSPAMVAAAGSDASTLSPVGGFAWVATCLVLLVTAAALCDHLNVLARLPFDRAPSTLVDRARDLERDFGYTEPMRDRAWGFTLRGDFLRWVRRDRGEQDVARILAGGRPPALAFWYRSSPDLMIPDGNAVAVFDPPAMLAGMTTIVLDTEGRLVGFERIPPQLATSDANATVDWSRAFAAAGLDPTRFSASPPQFAPRAFADTRLAWTGTLAELPDETLRIEAGSHLGRSVYFQMIGPWNRLTRVESSPAGESVRVLALIAVFTTPTLLLAAAMAARANVRRGRGDRSGAIRLAAAFAIASIGGWLFQAHHVADLDIEQTRFFRAVGRTLVDAGMLWLFYLAAEPHVRRTWPHILITWSRLLEGRFRDPMVGRDLVVGATSGAAMTVISYGFYFVLGSVGSPTLALHTPDLVLGTRPFIAASLFTLSNAMANAMLGVLGLALLRVALIRAWRPLGKTWVAFAVATATFSPLAARGQFQSGNFILDLTFGVILVAIILGVLFRYGLFAGIVGFFLHFLTWRLSLSLDSSRQYFEIGMTVLVVMAAIAIIGFALARGGQPLLARVAEE